jgi:hypothetical protein
MGCPRQRVLGIHLGRPFCLSENQYISFNRLEIHSQPTRVPFNTASSVDQSRVTRSGHISLVLVIRSLRSDCSPFPPKFDSNSKTSLRLISASRKLLHALTQRRQEGLSRGHHHNDPRRSVIAVETPFNTAMSTGCRKSTRSMCISRRNWLIAWVLIVPPINVTSFSLD